jgi:branched-chain amino acid transport system substrate-binding protein
MIGSKALRQSGLLVLACSGLILGACSSSSKSSAGSSSSSGGAAKGSLLGPSKPATGTPIKLGMINDGKSVAIDLTSEIPAAQAAAKYINEHLGGVGGHPITLDVCQDGETPSGTTNCVNQMIADKVVAVVYGVSGEGGTIGTGLKAANIPLVAYATIDQGTLVEKTGAYAITNGLGTLAGPAVLLQQSGGKRGAVVVEDLPAASGPVKQLDPIFYKNAGVTLDIVAIPAGTADMTPQIQAELSKHPDQVAILGNDAFCTSGIKALKTLGYNKQIVVIPQCVSPSSISAIPGGFGGMTQLTPFSSDPKDPEVALYDAVMAAYAPSTPPNGSVTSGGYGAVLAFRRAMSGVAANADITPAIVESTIASMSAQTMPLTSSLTFQCNGQQISLTPAICTTGFLTATLDAKANGSDFKPLNLTPLLKL